MSNSFASIARAHTIEHSSATSNPRFIVPLNDFYKAVLYCNTPVELMLRIYVCGDRLLEMPSVVLQDDVTALFAGANGSSLLDQAQERIDISHPELAPDTDRGDGRVGYFDLAHVVAIQFLDDVAERRIPERNVPLPPGQIFGFDLRDGLLSHQYAARISARHVSRRQPTQR